MLLLSKKSDFVVVQLEKIEKRSKKQDRMDLNELTPEFDYNFLDD